MPARNRPEKGIVRPLDPADPRSLGHPSHKNQWLELARALGRLEAREEYARMHSKEPADESIESRRR